MTLEDFVKNRKMIGAVREAIKQAYSPDADERLSARSALNSIALKRGGEAADINWNDDNSVGGYINGIREYLETEEKDKLENGAALVKEIEDSKLAEIAYQLPSGDKDDKLENYMSLRKDMDAVRRGEKSYSEIVGKIEKLVEQDIDSRNKDVSNKKALDGLKKAVKYTVRTSIESAMQLVDGYIKREKEEFENKYSEGERAEMGRGRILKLAEDEKTRDKAASYIAALAA